MTIFNIAAAATSAVVAGVYTNFSARVMPRLAGLPAADAVAAMQAFNRNALKAPFMTAFFAGAALGAYQVFRYVRGEHELYGVLAATAGVAHLAGFVITIAYNVPRNERLAALDAQSASAAGYWPAYLHEWTAANSARAGLAVAALVLSVAAAVAER